MLLILDKAKADKGRDGGVKRQVKKRRGRAQGGLGVLGGGEGPRLNEQETRMRNRKG